LIALSKIVELARITARDFDAAQTRDYLERRLIGE
jgi:hypothetical protein